jgi:hypothetical protein
MYVYESRSWVVELRLRTEYAKGYAAEKVDPGSFRTSLSTPAADKWPGRAIAEGD